MSNVRDAAIQNLPPCPVCGAWQGDPCRTPAGSTRAPHKARLSLSTVEG
jgi:hypothetical protein